VRQVRHHVRPAPWALLQRSPGIGAARRVGANSSKADGNAAATTRACVFMGTYRDR
jgi:hypothetical protein